MKTTRQTFVRGAIGVCTAGLLSAACGGDDGGGDSACSTMIGTNHGHEMTVSAADKEAAAPKTYNIQGMSDHAHTVELTATDFADLASGTILVVQSSTDAAHSHDVTITC